MKASLNGNIAKESVAGTHDGSMPLVISCLAPDQADHIRPVEKYFGADARFVYHADCDPALLMGQRPHLVLCVNDYPYPIARCLQVARSLDIPTLVLQDGILEWRCQYENPLFGAGGGAAQHQPVIADKIACLGAQSARAIRSWGNAGKVEITGMPRLDHLFSRPKIPRRSPPKRIVIMTAKNPGFTEQQRTITLTSLRDVASELSRKPEIEVRWRTSTDISRQLGVENQLSKFSSDDLAGVLEQADLVITTPSTSMLEAMLLDRPVAALDYHNVPRFVPTAWTISAREQILPVVTDMLAAPESKMSYQRLLLADCLACNGPAAPRVTKLIRKMVEASNDGRSDAFRQNLCPDVLDSEISGECQSYIPSLAALYPGQSLYQTTDVHLLQGQLARLQKHTEYLERELRRRTIRNGLFRVGQLAMTRLRKRFN